MNNNEICNMVISCAQGLLDGKEIQFRTTHGTWHLAEDHNLLQIITGITNGAKYRVKPEPKTVRVRPYWSFTNDEICGPYYAQNIHIDEPLFKFHSWAGDEQILTVPEI